MTKWMRHHGAGLCAALLFLAGLALAGQRMWQAADRHFVYTLDDPYIHLSLARNWIEQGVMGVTPHVFASATSSPLWTGWMALNMRVLGDRVWLPGLWAAVFAVLALLLTDRMARRLQASFAARLLACLAVLYFAPLVTLATTGMEHTLHLALLLLFFDRLLVCLDAPSRAAGAGLCLAAMAAVAARYETLFFIAPVVVGLAVRRQWRLAGGLVIAAALPVLGYGWFSAAHGGFWLPNSLMLKGRLPHGESLFAWAGGFIRVGFGEWLRQPALMGLSLLAVVAGALAPRGSAMRAVAWSVPAALAIHLCLARTGWFFRYEAYLVGAGVALLVPVIGRLLRRDGKAACAGSSFTKYGCRMAWVLLAVVPLHFRALAAHMQIGLAAKNIYQQQYQIARFLRQNFPDGARIAIHDIGAISYYYPQGRVLDLYGLADAEVVRLKRAGAWNSAAIRSLLAARRIDYVVVYPVWFIGAQALPAECLRVSSWLIPDLAVCGAARVSFYGTSPAASARLMQALAVYQPQLPRDVLVMPDRR